MSFVASRYHDISCGHRVYGHEGACAHLHGHNYRVHFNCIPETGMLDSRGRVVDFSVIKGILCSWLDDSWDHRFLVWADDPIAKALPSLDKTVVTVPFNPTAENMAKHLVEKVGPFFLAGLGIVLDSVTIEETRKCSATYRRPNG